MLYARLRERGTGRDAQCDEFAYADFERLAGPTVAEIAVAR
jgi:hypothetical protein